MGGKGRAGVNGHGTRQWDGLLSSAMICLYEYQLCSPHRARLTGPTGDKSHNLLHNPLKQLEDLSAEASEVYDKEAEQPACLMPEPGWPRVRWERTRRLYPKSKLLQ